MLRTGENQCLRLSAITTPGNNPHMPDIWTFPPAISLPSSAELATS